jgi:hypothetical protein
MDLTERTSKPVEVVIYREFPRTTASGTVTQQVPIWLRGLDLVICMYILRHLARPSFIFKGTLQKIKLSTSVRKVSNPKYISITLS